MFKKFTTTKDSTPVLKSRSYTKIFNTIWSVALLLIVFMPACKKDKYAGEVVGLCPIIVSTDPLDKAIDVALTKVISVTFNTEMDSTSITKATFTISQSGATVAGTVATTADAKVYTFKPDVPLVPFVTYTGTITTSSVDRFHTATLADYVWTFTTIPQVTTVSNPVLGGTTAGAGTFAQGSVNTVTATPNTGFTFTNWTVNGVIVSTSSSYQFTMAGNKALVANFAAIPAGNFAVNLSSSPAAGGTTAGAGSFATGSLITVTATPNAGYTFVNWTDAGVPVSTSTSYQFVLASNRTLVANFKIIPASQVALLLISSPPIGGTTNGSNSYPTGTSVTATATPNIGYSFVSWTENGTIVSTSPVYTFALNANRTLVANFLINTYNLALSATPAANGTTNGSGPYTAGSIVTATATPNAGSLFVNWTEAGNIVSTNASYQFTMTGNRTLVANFAPIPVAPALFTSIFGAFGGNAGITNQGLFTVINNGSIGTTGASTLVTGFHDITGDKYTETPLNVGNVAAGRIYTYAPPPTIFGPGGPFGGNAATKVIADNGLTAATAFYNSISPANKPGGTDPGAGELGGLTLGPGVYMAAGGTFKITNLDLVLDAKGDPNATWIFQTAASLTVGSTGTGAHSVKLIGGALAQNVYWYVGSTAVINYAGGGVMVGTIIANSGVTLSNPANSTNALVQTVLNGRAISLVSSVTMVNTVINVQ
ncbi:DUF3494 domain-containing protein [Mucilaginibacter sp. HMF5004]|uniref:InlB B-repeat-containing protein n=1 Tax=Mucilaginibacter rivuli TaxID=2857527 RepID=UPI001C5D9AE6|nr:ice-binding family protein [Mucilaginibacter rivuli]MBW4889759.1 DUF3494 domain-containing protein [Mucilaginibacter rivuli]